MLIDDRYVPTIRVINLGLRIAWYVLMITVVVSAVLSVSQRTGLVPREWVSLRYGAVLVPFREGDIAARFWYSPLLGSVSASIALFILHHVRRFFGSIEAGDPFTADNASRLRLIAGALLVRAGFETAVSVWMAFTVSRYLSVIVGLGGVGLNLGAAVDFWSLGLGLMVLVIAEVFRIGTGMREDLEYTI